MHPSSIGRGSCFALLVSLSMFCGTTARADERAELSGEAPAELVDAPRDAESARGWKNPFAGDAQPKPGRLSLGLHAGSVLGRGYGLDVGLTTFSWLEGKLAYGYASEHTGVAYLKATLIPSAHLSPYLVVGYSYGVANLRSISVKTHEAIAGLGLQARFADRFYVAGEVTANIVLLNTYSDRRVSTEVEISDPWALNVGFAAGVWLF